MLSQNYINHIGLVLDASGSMNRHREQLIKVADDQIAYLARRSKELDQETRVTVYMFNSTPKCIIYDKDVLRLPSIREVYQVGGHTALIDATLLSQKDLALTPEKYGDHAFLTYVLTDGEENASKAKSFELAKLLRTQPDHWTVAALVPNMNGKHEAKRFGFPADNIAIWSPDSNSGISEVGETIRAATESYMTARASGVRGTRTLFSTGVDALNHDTVAMANLHALDSHEYMLVPVPRDSVIKDFVEATGRPYLLGKAFYQLAKLETIQGNKQIAVVDNMTAQVYTGRNARDLIGLGNLTVRVRPNHNPQYTIFVQSTSVNRKLIAGTRLLLLS